MKLYTEEQVIHAIKMARSSTNIFTTPFLYDKEDILEYLTPIELPSDEEIDGDLIFHYVKRYESTIGEIMALKIGARWMRDKILNK